MNLLLIPLTNRLLQVLLTLYKIAPIIEPDLFGFPLLAMNRLNAFRKESVSRVWTISR